MLKNTLIITQHKNYTCIVDSPLAIAYDGFAEIFDPEIPPNKIYYILSYFQQVGL
jgi:hypothetical protein